MKTNKQTKEEEKLFEILSRTANLNYEQGRKDAIDEILKLVYKIDNKGDIMTGQLIAELKDKLAKEIK